MRIVEKVRFTRFDWHGPKEQTNLAKHGIDFDEALIALSRPHLEARSDRNGEVRILAICPHSDRVIAVVYAPRGDTCWIISARPARKNEKREYRLHYPG
ncbi:MAG: BrnT family toxin [Mesorhizobium sp.]|nr:BrnT family toxin [Mesorhizobium sp.]